MIRNVMQRVLTFFKSGDEPDSGEEPDPEFVARQLRKPSGSFAEQVGENMNRVNEPLFDVTLDAMQPKQGEKILEIGFGTGKFLYRLFRNVQDLEVYGIDFSHEMVDTARDNNEYGIASGQLNLRWGESDDLPFQDATFDKVFCNMVIYFWDNPKSHLKEVHRVLKESGTFYTGFRTRDSMQVFPFVQHGFNLFGVNEWKEQLQDQNFRVLDTRKSLDPRLELKGNEIQLESCCIIAQKDFTETTG